MLQFPDVFVGEDSCNFLPPENERPRKITEVEVKEKFPLEYAIQGYCPVTYVEGMKRYSTYTCTLHVWICMDIPYILKYKPGRLFLSSQAEVGVYLRQASIQRRRLLIRCESTLNSRADASLLFFSATATAFTCSLKDRS